MDFEWISRLIFWLFFSFASEAGRCERIALPLFAGDPNDDVGILYFSWLGRFGFGNRLRKTEYV